MKMVATTLRLEEDLKKAAERRALDEGITFQALFNQALRTYLDTQAEKQAKEIVFPDLKLGADSFVLTREEIYAD